MIYLRKNLIYLKQVYTFQSNQIKLQNPKPSVPFEKINCTFINNLKSKETKSKIKAHLSYLANSNFYNYKTSPSILRQHCVWRNLRNNKDIITEPDKGKGAVTLDKKLHDNAIQEIISDTSKFEKLNEGPSLKREASLQRFLRKLKQKKRFSMKLNMINCILLVLLLLISILLQKWANSPLVIHFQNFVWLFHL